MSNTKKTVQVSCEPSADRREVTIKITSPKEIGVQDMIRALAHFMKHTLDTNKLSFEDCAIRPNDKLEKIE